MWDDRIYGFRGGESARIYVERRLVVFRCVDGNGFFFFLVSFVLVFREFFYFRVGLEVRNDSRKIRFEM